MALVDVAGSPRRRVRPEEVRVALGAYRARPVSERYVRRILLDLVDRRIDGLPLVVQYRTRSAKFEPLNTALSYVERRREPRP